MGRGVFKMCVCACVCVCVGGGGGGGDECTVCGVGVWVELCERVSAYVYCPSSL